MTSPPDPAVPESAPARWSAATAAPDMWLDSDADPREVGAVLTDERSTLTEYLRVYRVTLELKCADLDAEQLARRSVPPSTLSLLGLVRHLTEVERHWFRRALGGASLDEAPQLYCREEREGDFHGAAADPALVEQAWQAWRAEVEFAEAFTAEHDLSMLGTTRRTGPVSLREVLVHMIEEYARHIGHADLLRECIDGRIGQ